MEGSMLRLRRSWSASPRPDIGRLSPETGLHSASFGKAVLPVCMTVLSITLDKDGNRCPEEAGLSVCAEGGVYYFASLISLQLACGGMIPHSTTTVGPPAFLVHGSPGDLPFRVGGSHQLPHFAALSSITTVLCGSRHQMKTCLCGPMSGRDIAAQPRYRPGKCAASAADLSASRDPRGQARSRLERDLEQHHDDDGFTQQRDRHAERKDPDEKKPTVQRSSVQFTSAPADDSRKKPIDSGQGSLADFAWTGRFGSEFVLLGRLGPESNYGNRRIMRFDTSQPHQCGATLRTGWTVAKQNASRLRTQQLAVTPVTGQKAANWISALYLVGGAAAKEPSAPRHALLHSGSCGKHPDRTATAHIASYCGLFMTPRTVNRRSTKPAKARPVERLCVSFHSRVSKTSPECVRNDAQLAGEEGQPGRTATKSETSPYSNQVGNGGVM
ncbi:hypothetical protein FQR65_LT20232 [Abscondita terminalis]|nr:hypothetical protein FQR65_LT20232 [Abscondita terminalis]